MKSIVSWINEWCIESVSVSFFLAISDKLEITQRCWIKNISISNRTKSLHENFTTSHGTDSFLESTKIASIESNESHFLQSKPSLKLAEWKIGAHSTKIIPNWKSTKMKKSSLFNQSDNSGLSELLWTSNFFFFSFSFLLLK